MWLFDCGMGIWIHLLMRLKGWLEDWEKVVGFPAAKAAAALQAQADLVCGGLK